MTTPTVKRTLVVVLFIVLVLLAFLAVSSPIRQGGSAHSTGDLGITFLGQPAHAYAIHGTWPRRRWKHKGVVRHWHRHFSKTTTRSLSRARVGPSYRIDAETHGDSWAVDKVVQGWLHAHITMSGRNHSKILNRYSGVAFDHRESWWWGLDDVSVTKNYGVSSTWCLSPGEVGVCKPVEYLYVRVNFDWQQAIFVEGIENPRHIHQYVGCTLRSGGAGWSCGTGSS